MTSPDCLRIAWLTNAPSADQIDLLSALASRPDVDLRVFYCSADSVKGQIDSRAPFGRGLSLTGSKLPGLSGGVFLNPSIIGTLTRSPYDVLIVSGYAHPTMQLAMLVRAFQRKPWLLFAERPGLNQTTYWRGLTRKIAMLMVRSAHGVIGTGRLAQESFALHLRPSTELFSIPYLINHENFFRVKRSPTVPATVSFMACGQLIRRKGFDVLINAFQSAAQDYQDISLTIVGDGPERASLAAAVNKNFRDRIRFIGSVPFDRRAEVFAQAEVFVHPARHDGWGVVVHEALAAGMPVIATKQTGAAYELVEDGKNGFLIDADNEVPLRDSILWFARNRLEIPQFSDRARAAVIGLTPEWGAAELVRITRSVTANCDA